MTIRTVHRAIPLLALAVLVAGCDALFGREPRSTCVANRSLPLNSTFFEEIEDYDCNVGGLPTDQYTLRLTSPQVLRISVTNEFAMANSLIIASQSDLLVESPDVREEGITDHVLYVALPTGDYRLYYAGTDGDRGAYMVTTQTFVAPGPAGCVTSSTRSFYVAPGSRMDGAFTADDCEADAGTSDSFTLLAKVNRSYTVTLTPTVAASIEVLDELAVEESADAPAGQATTLTFTVPANKTLTIRVSAASVGTYSLALD